MSVYLTTDPHLGHRNIGNFRKFVRDTQHNTDLFVADWKKHVNKRGIVYMFGDVAFDQNSLDILASLPGKKILIKGNHDDMVSTFAQTSVFDEIHGMLKYKGFWLTHAPIHPQELRGKVNIHGHTHNHIITKRTWYGRTVVDDRYLNLCPDVIYPKYGKFILSLEEVRKIVYGKANL